jgi:hypothetical protein
MLDFAALHNRTRTLVEFTEGLNADELHRLTGEMIDTMLGLITPAYPRAALRNAILRFNAELAHNDIHMQQIRNIIQQANAAQSSDSFLKK